jgi:pyruvyl transferase EpsI
LDKKKLAYDEITMYETSVNMENRARHVRDKLQEFASGRLVITDRLHGMLFAVITSTPCIAIDNCSHKVSGTYGWLKSIPFVQLVTDISEIENAVDVVMHSSFGRFDAEGFSENYGLLRELVNKNLEIG